MTPYIVELADTFDGLGTAIVAGVISALVAVGSALLVNMFERRRHVEQDRRALADALIRDVGTIWDDVQQVHATGAGDVEISSLWVHMADLDGRLGDRELHKRLRSTYRRLAELRSFIRFTDATQWTEEQKHDLTAFVEALDLHLNQLVANELTTYRSGRPVPGSAMTVELPGVPSWGYDPQASGAGSDW